MIWKFVNSPIGPKTTHFWGPVFTWGFVVAGLADSFKPPELINTRLTTIFFFYSCAFMRLAIRV